MLEKLDRAVELGDKYGMHVSTNFYRGPGYSVNREFTEPHNLWKDAEALKAFCFQWQMLVPANGIFSRSRCKPTIS